MQLKYLTYMGILMSFLFACGQISYVRTSSTYKGGNQSNGQTLVLSPNGRFNLHRWAGYTEEKVEGKYRIKGKKMILNTTVVDDSLRFFEQVNGETDSIYLQFEIWNANFEKKLSFFTHLRARFYKENSLVQEHNLPSGYLQLANFEFDALELISSGVLLKKYVQRKHANSNFFYGQYCFGNSHLNHLLFKNVEWHFGKRKIIGQLYSGEGREKIILEQYN